MGLWHALSLWWCRRDARGSHGRWLVCWIVWNLEDRQVHVQIKSFRNNDLCGLEWVLELFWTLDFSIEIEIIIILSQILHWNPHMPIYYVPESTWRDRFIFTHSEIFGENLLYSRPLRRMPKKALQQCVMDMMVGWRFQGFVRAYRRVHSEIGENSQRELLFCSTEWGGETSQVGDGLDSSRWRRPRPHSRSLWPLI